MKIQTPVILKSLGFCVNLLFKNRENRKKEEKQLKNYIYILLPLKKIVIVLIKTSMSICMLNPI